MVAFLGAAPPAGWATEEWFRVQESNPRLYRGPKPRRACRQPTPDRTIMGDVARRRTSILNNREAVAEAISKAVSIAAALRSLGLRSAGGNHAMFLAACERHGLEPPIFDRTANKPMPARMADSDMFRVGSTATNGRIRVRLLALGVVEECAICGIGPRWNRRPLVLQIDHMNGKSDDNRRDNLRLLCPNCHSQTDTFCGRSLLWSNCPYCSARVRKDGKRCGNCKRYLVKPSGGHTKIVWPDGQALLAEVRSTSMLATGRRLGVSDVAVRKRLRKLGLLTQI